MSSGQRTLILPVETAARELDGKILLSLVARERGWAVYMGDQTVIRKSFATLPRGVYLSKSARSKNASVFRHMQAAGNQIAVLDEESLVRQTDDIYLMKHEVDALEHVNVLMTWGEENKQLWVGSGKCNPGIVYATGNPRVDMLRRDLRAYHKPEIDTIHARYGEYVLFNSNFATVNHFIAGATRFGLASWVSEEEKQRQKSTLLAHKKKLFDAFIQVLPRIAAAIAPMTLVVRPHPSESHAAWDAAIAGHKNAAVVFEGSVVPWLAGARALIHNGCTTAVESAVLGMQSISYMPVTSAAFDNPLPNGLSVECADEAALLAAVRETIAEGPRPLNSVQRATLDYFVTGQTGPLSCDNVMAALENVDVGRGVREAGMNARRLRTSLVQWAASGLGSRLMRKTETLYARGRQRQAGRARKFPQLTLGYLGERVDRYRDVLGRFNGRTVREVQHHLFSFD